MKAPKRQDSAIVGLAAEAKPAELAVLGAMIHNPEAMAELRAVLSGHDFANPLHADLFALLVGMADAGLAVDAVSLHDRAVQTGADAATDALIFDAVAACPAPSAAKTHAATVRRLARHRQAIYTAQEALRDLSRADSDVGEVLGKLSEEFGRLARDTGGPRDDAVLVNLADVQPQRVRWLWPCRIPLGKVSMISGDPGLGKSFLTLDMAARVSRGDGWPGCPGAQTKPGGVVLLSAEDDAADTIRPRLDAAGADVSRIVLLSAVRDCDNKGERTFDLSRDLTALDSAIKATTDCRLVVVDPIGSYLGKTDAHRNEEVRAVLAPLAALAARCGVAVVIVNHLRKAEGSALHRGLGSVGFVGQARAAHVVCPDLEDPSGRRRLMLPTKCNLAPDGDGMAYRLDTTGSPNGHPVVLWESQPVTTKADDALAFQPQRRGPPPTERDEAADWLRAALADGPREAAEVKAEAEAEGFTPATLRRAQRQLGIKPTKVGYQGRSLWSLPTAGESTQ